jgi:hypothetical protein
MFTLWFQFSGTIAGSRLIGIGRVLVPTSAIWEEGLADENSATLLVIKVNGLAVLSARQSPFECALKCFQ